MYREHLIELAEQYLEEDTAIPTDLYVSMLNEGLDMAAIEASLPDFMKETDDLD